MTKLVDHSGCPARAVALVLSLVLFMLATPTPASAEGETGVSAYVHATHLILRKQAKEKGSPITQLDQNDTVTVLDYKGEWVYVAYKKHKGYVKGEYLTLSGTPSIDTPAISDARSTAEKPQSTALRQDDQGEAVRELQQLLAKVGYSVSTDGVFGERTEQAVISFQASVGLTADGLAGQQTLALLRVAPAGSAAQSTTQSTGKVELLDWWKSGSNAFPVGTKATVVDVRTGIRFTIRRWGGVNHADVEPYTAEDTAKMKRAYGGAWSWERRPIWVIVGGRVIAASMNGMPHMGYSNKTNEFPGHFCIHMKNSRTHGSNRVDEGHSAAVNEAYESRSSY